MGPIPGLQRRPSTILSGARELGLSTSLALLAGELVLATETKTCFPLETGIRFPLGSETETCFPLERGIRFPLGSKTETRFPLETGIRFQLGLETNTVSHLS
jgi:hypothetical protein